MSKNHNLRQRKKLHLGEFKELGFNLEITLKDDIADSAINALINEFFAAVIEPRHLMYGGSLAFGFVCRDTAGDATEEDRAAIRAWLESRSEIASTVVGELVDAWR